MSKIITALLLIALCSGCASVGMTPRQHFWAGQTSDAVSTAWALEVEDGFVEGNGLLGDIEGVIIGKAIYICSVELMARAFPKNADLFYNIGAFFGYGAGAWNVYQIGAH